jgi:coproporphyrinogen III oxidase
MNQPDLNEIIAWLKGLQHRITVNIERLDGQAFVEDVWEREEGGGGRSRLLRNGNLVEKGGVNFSHVHGPVPEFLKKESPAASRFDATGVSLVIHPHNPHVPLIHMNVRYFETDAGDCWFGGGIDLTPAYPVEEQVRWFHEQLKTICDRFEAAWHPRFKAWCDDYFTIAHRNEMRGVGGIFYDHLRPGETADRATLFAFMQAVGDVFNDIYTYMADQNRAKPWNETEKTWQKIRRGRYAEFNLVYDRGTTFGLKTNGRVESILMSLPPEAIWEYNHQPAAGSPEAAALAFYQPQHWA